jgi:hypothetical protein
MEAFSADLPSTSALTTTSVEPCDARSGAYSDSATSRKRRSAAGSLYHFDFASRVRD